MTLPGSNVKVTGTRVPAVLQPHCGSIQYVVVCVKGPSSSDIHAPPTGDGPCLEIPTSVPPLCAVNHLWEVTEDDVEVAVSLGAEHPVKLLVLPIVHCANDGAGVMVTFLVATLEVP